MNEQNNLDQSKDSNKKSNRTIVVPLLIAIFILVIVIGFGAYVMYDKGILFTDTEISNKETDSKKDIVEKEDTNSDEIKPLDLTKCLNNNTNTYSDYTDIEGNQGLTAKVNDDKRSATLSINWDVFGPLSTATSYSSGTIDYQITGFTKEVNQVFIGDFGQDSMGITLFYLMADGTVEYTPMFQLKRDSQNNTYYDMNYTYDTDAEGKMSNPHFTPKSALSGVKEVVKFYTINASNGTGWRTTIGATKNGSFYDLGAMITNE